MNKIERIMKEHLDMPKHKIEYIIRNPSLVEGLWEHMAHYDVEYTKKNNNLLIEIVQDILNGPHIEREWSEEEYNNFVLFKGD